MLPKRSIVRFNTLYADDIYVAHEEIRETVKRYGNNTSKIELLPNAVNPDKMIPHDKREVRKEIGLNPNDFWIGFVGSIKDRHCLEELFKAVKNIRKNQRPSILIIGEGPRKSVLESLSDKLGLNTRFVGFVQHGKVDKYLSSCDVSYAVVDPDEPSNPIKCYESCACECPVITSKKSEFEFIEKNDLGFVVNHPGVETLVSAIKEAQNTSEDEMQDMGRRARRYVKQNYTWDQFASRVIDS